MRGVLAELPARLPGFLRGFLPAVSYPQVLVALAVVTVLPALVALAGDLRRPGPATVFLLLVQAVMLVNVASHVGAAVLLRGYAPGLATALVVNLPFSLWLLRRARRERWVGGRTLAWLVPAALLVHGPGLVALLAAAGWVAGGR